MATPAKRPCLESGEESSAESSGSSSSSSVFVAHTPECRGTIEEADALAKNYLESPNENKASLGSCQLLPAAVKAGHFNCIESLLDAGIDVNDEYCCSERNSSHHPHQFSFPKTSLITAIHKGRLNIVKLLVSRGALVNPLQKDDIEDSLFRYPLFHALNRDNTEMVALLLELGADPNKHPESQYGCSFVELALQTGRRSIFKMLVEHGARVTKPYNYMVSAIKRRDMDTFKCLVKHDAFLNLHKHFTHDDKGGPEKVFQQMIKAHENAPATFTRHNVNTFLKMFRVLGFNFWSEETESLLTDLRALNMFDILEDVEQVRKQPLSLKETARIAIQRIVGIHLPMRIKHMNLPKVLEKHLRFTDIDAINLQDNLPKNTIMLAGGQRQVLIFHFPTMQ
ncbi:uncharacterized protein LOC132195237 isoform X2 [Neocloeon triangulifer]|nr:uncharacterized protein LOC132195237 isoform X2 [Neocloeon triangulifer]XP_059473079.1 uncharacterized protein LOC132195237 isoform X2 [Neocloeon triangulifer]